MRLKLWIAAVGIGLVASGAMANPERWKSEWPVTDFSNTTVEDWNDIRGGGPPKDGIPAIDDPTFISVADETRLDDREPVVTVAIDGETARTYPLRYLVWHEIVNDEAGGVPFAVTYCPLCNSVPVFDRRLDGVVYNFGVSGKLRDSNLIMFDRQTETWWQQATGEGIVGTLANKELTQIPSWQESWGEFKAANPDGLVMDEPAARRRYGTNPYAGYDSSRRPFLYSGEEPPNGVPSLMRVVRVDNRAWTLERLREENVITEAGVTISWAAGQASALDSRVISEGRDIGTIRVRDADGNDVSHDIMFAFAYDAFWPDGEWMLGN